MAAPSILQQAQNISLRPRHCHSGSGSSHQPACRTAPQNVLQPQTPAATLPRLAATRGQGFRHSSRSWNVVETHSHWRCGAGRAESVHLDNVVQRQGELLRSMDKRLDSLEQTYSKEIREIKMLIEELRRGVCRPQKEVAEDAATRSSWTNEEKVAKFRILAQIMADEVVEAAQMLSRESLGHSVQAAVSNGKITMAGGVEIMQAGLIASGMNLEPLHVVADTHPDAPLGSEQKFAILPEHVDLVLSRTANLKVALGTSEVLLPVLLGESIHPDAAAHASAAGVHVIARSQGPPSPVC